MKSFIAGLGIGTLLGMAFAPAKGEETRMTITERAHDMRQAAGDQAARFAAYLQRAAHLLQGNSAIGGRVRSEQSDAGDISAINEPRLRSRRTG